MIKAKDLNRYYSGLKNEYQRCGLKSLIDKAQDNGSHKNGSNSNGGRFFPLSFFTLKISRRFQVAVAFSLAKRPS